MLSGFLPSLQAWQVVIFNLWDHVHLSPFFGRSQKWQGVSPTRPQILGWIMCLDRVSSGFRPAGIAHCLGLVWTQPFPRERPQITMAVNEEACGSIPLVQYGSSSSIRLRGGS